MELARLPPEVVAQICSFVPSSKVLSMWLSGDSRIRRNLSYVTSIELSDPASCSTSRWPLALASFPRLKSLAISRPSGPLGRQLVPLELAKMRNLTTLSLSLSQKDMESVLDALESSKEFFWPELQTLGLAPINPFQPRYLKAITFPDTLTHYSTSATAYELGHLPRQIKKFSFQPTNRHLLAFSCSIANPPDLESLSTIIPIDWTAELSTATFPSTLTELEITVRKDEHLQWLSKVLPPQLTSLHICTYATILHHFVPTATFRHLRRLRRLKLNSDSMPGAPHATGTFQHQFPPNLCPSGLEELVLKLNIYHSEITLPPKLKSLDLSACFIALSLVIYHLAGEHSSLRTAGLPPSLEILKTPHLEHGNCAGKSDALYELIANPVLNDQILSTASSPVAGIQSLTLPQWWTTFKYKTLLQSPAFNSLTFLRIVKADAFQAHEFAFLPPTLTTLIMTFESLRNSLVDTIYAQLPPRLRILSFSGWTNAHTLSKVGLRGIARLMELEELCTGFSILNVPDDAIALLPRSLRHLSLSGPTTLSGACFAHLPRFLKSLSITNKIRVKEDHYRLLPRSLTSCNLFGTGNLDVNAIKAPSPLKMISLHDASDRSRFVLLKSPDLDSSDPVDVRTYSNSFLSHNHPDPPHPGEDDWICEGEELSVDEENRWWKFLLPVTFLSRLWSRWR